MISSPRQKQATLLILLFLAACAPRNKYDTQPSITANLLRCEEEYNISGFSFLLIKDNHLVSRHYSGDQANREVNNADSILANFTAPLLLDQLIRDSVLNERDSAGPRLKARDLIYTPTAYYDTGRQAPDWQTAKIQALIHQLDKRHPKALTPDRIGLSDKNKLSDLFENLRKISGYMDATYPEYATAGDSIPDVLPGWYVEGLSRFYGWYILKFQGRTVLWNCFKDGATTILVIKSMDRKICLAASYTSGNILSPMDLNNRDLLQSPIGLALINALYLPDAAGIDYSQPQPWLLARLEKIPPTYRFLPIQDLAAHILLFERTGKGHQAEVLRRVHEKLTGDSLLNRYAGSPTLASIGRVTNNQQAVVPFRVDEDCTVQLFAGGQVKVPVDYENNSPQYDNVQFFINDHVGEKTINVFDTHLFQFNYGSTRSRVTDADCAIGTPSDTNYIVEARISRKQLADKRLVPGRRLLANVLVGDCDLYEDYRESVLSWAVAQNESFADFTKYGSVLLTNKAGPPDPKKAYALPATRPPAIDGRVDSIWDRASWSPIRLPYLGTTTPSDNAGKFKILFDEEYLYVLFDITDECRNRLGLVSVDKCWIEDAAGGKIVWKMSPDTVQGSPSFTMNQRIYLHRGNYLLKYFSDKDNSYDHWFGRPPQNGIYGASLYIAK